MKLIFSHVHLVNFMSFLDASVNLDGQDYTLVEGENLTNSDNAKSNGSGKSAIFDAIMWALTGDTIRGGKNVKNIYADDGAYVELDFSVNTDTYKIIRSKDHSEYKTNLKIYKNNEDVSGKGIRDSEKLLAEYLPDLTTELLGSVVVLGQGLPQKFTGNTPAGRKEILEKLSKSDFMIEDLKRRITERKGEISTDTCTNEDTALSLTTKIKMIGENIEAADKQLTELLNMGDLSEELQSHQTHLIELQKSVDTYTAEVDKYEAEIVKAVEATKAFNAEVESEMEKISAPYNDRIAEVKERLDALKVANATNMADINNATKKLRELESVTDVCPTCGRKLDGVEKPDTTGVKAEIEALRAKAIELDSEHKTVTTEFNAVNDEAKKAIADYKASVAEKRASLDEAETDLREYKKQSTMALKSFTDDVTRETSAIHSIEVQMASRDANIARCKETINAGKKEIEGINAELEKLNKEHDVLTQRSEIIAKFNTVVARDFRGYLLQSIIGFISAKAKEYATCLFGHDNIQFELQGNNINICFQTKEYELLSGGERQKIDLIIQFALRDMMCTYLGFSSNIIVLDEIMDFLDSDGCNAVINLLSYAIHDVSSTFIITHHSDLNLPCDNVIHIVKRDPGVSSIC